MKPGLYLAAFGSLLVNATLLAILSFPVAAHALNINDRIHTIVTAADLRDSAGGSSLGTKKPDDRGTIIGGPTTVDGTTWWRVDFDQTTDGWVKDTEIEKMPFIGRFYAQDSTWTTPIPANPTIVPNSANYIQRIINDFSSISENANDASIPIWYARADTPYVTVAITRPDLPATSAMGWNHVPIPPEAQPGYYNLDGNHDSFMAVVSWDRRYVWGLYYAHKNTDGTWSAAVVRKYDLSKSGSISPFDYLVKLWAPVDVAPPLGLVTYEELRAGHINHALRFGFYDTSAVPHWVLYPGEDYVNGADTDTWALLGGERLQLDPAVNCEGFVQSAGWTSAQVTICKAMQEYGMIFSIGTSHGNNVFYAEQLGDNYNDNPSYNNGKPIKWSLFDNGHYAFGNDFSALDLHNLRIVEAPRPTGCSTPPYSCGPTSSNTVVQAKQDLPIYESPFDTSTPTRTITSGSRGVIISPDDPVTVGGINWRFVNFDADDRDPNQHNHGWVRADLLDVLSSPLSPPTAPSYLRVQ